MTPGRHARAKRRGAPRVVLTFDDGPGPSTPALLDVLAAAGVPATFFLLGQNIERGREIAVRTAREGHVLGNHTYSHARPGALDDHELVAEIERTDALISAVARDAGIPLVTPIPLRAPYGLIADDPRARVLASIGRDSAGWTADFGDWNEIEPRELEVRMAAHVAAQHARGLDAVLDLHDASRLGAERPWTVEAVQRLISRLGAGAFGAFSA